MIHELRILPPLAIARFGSAPTPMDNYDAVVDPAQPLGYRRLVPAETLELDIDSGEIARSFVPDELSFKEGDRVRPVAPFLEVWALTGDEQLTGGGRLEPLTLDLLGAEGAAVSDLTWQVEVANLKAHRRTRETDDRVTADTGEFSDHARRPLTGRCEHFLPDKSIGLGHVQFVKPTSAHPEIRLRFTPAGGFVYGSDREPSPGQPSPDPNLTDVVYDARRPWNGHLDFPENPDERDPAITAPPQIYAGHGIERGDDVFQVSDAYLDDGCDGFVRVTLTLGARTLSALGRVGSGPPTYAPDAVPIRTVADELEQALFGLAVDPADATYEHAEEIVRRAFETIRLINTAAANDNTWWVGGGRFMDPSLVDAVALEGLHQSLLVALRSGTVPWFADILRGHDQAADLTDRGRRRMPAMMRGADRFQLALTRRQVAAIRKLAEGSLFTDAGEAAATSLPPIQPTNLAAQLHHHAAGNPPSTLPHSAISNCYPGLEFDFRNIWRRIFEGIELHEASGLVVSADSEHSALVQSRSYLLAVDGVPTRMPATVSTPDGGATPAGLVFMEWSNALADIVADRSGEVVECTFGDSPGRPLEAQTLRRVRLQVRQLFVHSDVTRTATALIDEVIAQPGELTQSLCSPWQNDYRECGCYYWAASRPDYVNVEPTEQGISTGNNWMAADREAEYTPDDPRDPSQHSYQDLFQDWERLLRFIVGGRDSGG